ncbi:hypothetical protein [Embleya sp. NBC_00896]|uniref:hypothetical protein n=1 Tax=Embleya sp. NBC_00896 TaxID=2975961 RepID=UPI002F90BDB2|nr:hypothetical protein OG928_48560 [Embleya sp. NBC_00896]
MTGKTLPTPPAANDDQRWTSHRPGIWIVVPRRALQLISFTVQEPPGSGPWRILPGAHEAVADSAEYHEATDRAHARALIAQWAEENRATTVYHWDRMGRDTRLECATTVDDWDRRFPRFYVGYVGHLICTQRCSTPQYTANVAERAIAEQQAAILLAEHPGEGMSAEVMDEGPAPFPHLVEHTRIYSSRGREGVITMRFRDRAVVSWTDGWQPDDPYPSTYPLDLMRDTPPKPFYPHLGQSSLR